MERVSINALKANMVIWRAAIAQPVTQLVLNAVVLWLLNALDASVHSYYQALNVLMTALLVSTRMETIARNVTISVVNAQELTHALNALVHWSSRMDCVPLVAMMDITMVLVYARSVTELAHNAQVVTEIAALDVLKGSCCLIVAANPDAFKANT